MISPPDVLPRRSHAALPPEPAAPLRVDRVATIDALDRSEWDALVPRDAPHLRSGFLAALERSGQCNRPQYLRVFADGRLVGVAFAYHLRVDLLTLAPRRHTRALNAFRTRFAPGLLYLGSMTCGPIVTNCGSNIHLAPDLAPEDRTAAAALLVDAIQSIPGAPRLSLFFEFADSQAAVFGPVLAARGFLQGISLPGTRLDVHWRTLDDYVAQMRKAFRRTVVKDRAMGEGLAFEMVDDFSEIAEEAWALYSNVVDRADYVLQTLSPEFFRALATVEESRLVVARDRSSGRIVGVELLLCGDTVLQDVFTGLDYAHNADQRLYFNLVYPVIDYAGQKGFRQISLGQTAYSFKSRLGVSTYPLYIFARHRNSLVQRALVALKPVLFPETPTVSHKVFRDESPE
jgi:predicted N-acyltransferase